MIKNYPTISVIVPNWNTKDQILQFLDSIQSQIYPKSAIEIVVVDNGSSDGSADAVDAWMNSQAGFEWFNLKCIRLSFNIGIAAGYNIGYENCSKNAWAVMRGESDVELTADCLEIMVKTLIDLPDVGIVGAKGVRFDEPQKIDHAARHMNWWTGSLRGHVPLERTDCDCVFGGTFLVRSECLQRMKYFFDDKRFLASELELCTRVKRYGYRVVCEPKAVSLHKIARSTHKLCSWKFNYISQIEGILFQLKYNRFPNLAVYLGYSMLRGVCRFLKGDSIPLLALRDSVLCCIRRTNNVLPGKTPNKSLTIPEWLSLPD